MTSGIGMVMVSEMLVTAVLMSVTLTRLVRQGSHCRLSSLMERFTKDQHLEKPSQAVGQFFAFESRGEMMHIRPGNDGTEMTHVR